MNTLNDLLGSSSDQHFKQPIQALRATAREALAGKPLPSRATESWKYSARRIGTIAPSLVSTSGISTPEQNSSPANAPSLDVDNSITVQVIDGELQEPNLILPAGLSIKSLSELSDTEISALLSELKNPLTPLEFEQVNQAQFKDIVVISVAKNVQIQVTVKLDIIHRNSLSTLPRVFVELGESSSLTLIQNFSYQDHDSVESEAPASGEAATISHEDFVIGANAKFSYLRMNIGYSSAKLIGSTRAYLKKDARFNSHSLCLGAQLGRHDFQVLLTEAGAECDLNGVCVTKDKQHFDNHTSIEHIAPHCISNENYRCIADDQSQIVFNGRIHILPDAQKTLGSMSNKNLLLSSSAEIDSKPELEIYADDVKCAHGTTIGQLNEKEVYYLKTRGLTDDQARQMLTLGFVLEIVRAAPIPEVADYWEGILADLLSFKD